MIYTGDCLSVLKEFESNSIDLIYLDPPFNSGRDYGAFNDSWRESTYLQYMNVRLNALYRVLKKTGSLYLHCDPTSSHYLKILLDDCFGAARFRNEIVWFYRKFGRGGKNFKKTHDILLYYSKGDLFTFNQLFEDYSPKTRRDKYKRTMIGGKWRPDKSFPMPDNGGVALGNVWEISFISSQSKERTGYPTQKPLALLTRIIEASSNEGDLILDPFCGSGTTLVAAQSLNRKYVGIDISESAVSIAKSRL